MSSTRLFLFTLCAGGSVYSFSVYSLYTGLSQFSAGATETSPLPLNAPLAPLPTMPRDIADCLRTIAQARNGSRATFVQIGANDGIMFDPLYNTLKDQKGKWIGIQAEPQPNLYSKLAVLHADAPGWSFYHGALAPGAACTNGTIAFCETRTPGEGNWLTQGQLNTIDPFRCQSNRKMYVLQQRPCESSFKNLINKHASPAFRRHAAAGDHKVHLDLLQIDVEGNDYEILSAIDWDFMKPTCIQYERRHLQDEESLLEALLAAHGYSQRKTRQEALHCLVANKASDQPDHDVVDSRKIELSLRR